MEIANSQMHITAARRPKRTERAPRTPADRAEAVLLTRVYRHNGPRMCGVRKGLQLADVNSLRNAFGMAPQERC